MNPFVYTEFWLSLAFIVVIGLFILPPVRRSIKRFFMAQRQDIIDQIQQADSVLNEAQSLFKLAQKKAQLKQNTKEINKEIKAIQKEFSEKTKAQVDVKKQDFQMRYNLTALQMKNHLRTELLNQTEEQVLKKSSAKSLDKEVSHLIKMLHKNEEQLRISLK